MERDFLGVIGKESGAMSKDDGRCNLQDSVFYGNGSGIQWPSSNKTSPLPPFMSIKTIREEKTDQFSISGFQPKPENFNTNPRTSAPLLTQQYAVHGYGSSVTNANGSRVYPVMSHHSVPFMQSNPFVKVNNSGPSSQNVTITPVKQQSYGGGVNLNGHLVGSTVGVFVQREVPKPSPTAQMTIFYAGSVFSFDNIPVDKAKEILMLAKAVNAAPPTIEPPKVETSVEVVGADSLKISNPMQAQKHSPIVVTPSCPVTSSPVSIVSPAAALSRSASSSNNSDSNMTKSLSPLRPSSQPEPSSSLPSKLSPTASPPAASGAPANLTTGLDTAASLAAGLSNTTAASIMPRAVPQARKASLARFLERRKERVSTTPYSKLSEKGDVCQSNNSLTPKSSTGVDQSRNCDDSFSFGQSNNTSYTTDAPSTELQI